MDGIYRHYLAINGWTVSDQGQQLMQMMAEFLYYVFVCLQRLRGDRSVNRGDVNVEMAAGKALLCGILLGGAPDMMTSQSL